MAAWFARFGRRIGLAVVGLLLVVLAVVGWAIVSPARKPSSAPPVAQNPTASAPKPALPHCDERPAESAAATENARTVDQAVWSPFGRPERGWRTYAALVQQEIGTDCAPHTPGFASAVAGWKTSQGITGDGALDEVAFRRMASAWLLRRPFIQATRAGGCPPSPPVESLQQARREEGYVGKQVAAIPPALAAYRAMVARARADVPEIAADPQLLTIFSGYRGPAEEKARCAKGGCNRLTMARCSAHRTGTALDLNVGNAPGSRPDSSADFNRRAQSATPAYTWLAAHAADFGFLPYPFEPWHWEWVGEAAAARRTEPVVSLAAQRTPRMNAHSVR